MNYEFKTDLSVEEVKAFLKQHAKPDGFWSVMSSSNPDQLFLTQNHSQFKLFLSSGRRITPTLVCTISPGSGSTLISGDLKYNRAIYLAVWGIIGLSMIFASHIIRSTDNIHLSILPLGFIVGSGVCLLRMKFGKHEDKSRLINKVTEMINKMHNQSTHSIVGSAASE